LGVGVGYIGKRSLPFSQFSDPTLQIDASASLRWRWLKASVAVTNLTDRRFPLSQFFYASDFHSRAYPTLAPASHFTAAAPRIVLFTLEVALDREGN
jgi:outer membrane receptor protein involved in Fe transport